MEHLFSEIMESEHIKDETDKQLSGSARERMSQANRRLREKVKEQEKRDAGGPENDDDEDEVDDDDEARFRVRCFTVDIDSEIEFFEEWNNKGVPFVVFYFNGRQVVLKRSVTLGKSMSASSSLELSSSSLFAGLLHKPKFSIVDGGVLGALKRVTLEGIVARAQARSTRKCEYTVYV